MEAATRVILFVREDEIYDAAQDFAQGVLYAYESRNVSHLCSAIG